MRNSAELNMFLTRLKRLHAYLPDIDLSPIRFKAEALYDNGDPQARIEILECLRDIKHMLIVDRISTPKALRNLIKQAENAPIDTYDYF